MRHHGMHCRLMYLYTLYSEVGLYDIFRECIAVCIETNNGTVRLIVRWLCYAERRADCFNQTICCKFSATNFWKILDDSHDTLPIDHTQ